jgi:hypothetical protein
VSQNQSRRGLEILDVFAAWKSILTGSAPMMSIEITRECPLEVMGMDARLGNRRDFSSRGSRVFGR